MAVTIPATVQITKMQEFLLAAMAAQPVQRFLENTNHAYRYHRPPLISAMPHVAAGHSRDGVFTIPCTPSADGLRYTFVHLILPAYTGNLTLKVESGNGDGPTTWTTIYAATVHAVVNATWKTITHTATIAANEDRVRVSYTGSGGAYLPSHILAYPDPDPAAVPFVAPYGIRPSGFCVFDDGLIGTAGAPINTEMLDRCRRNAVAVLTDRWTPLFSFVQEDGSVAQPVLQAPFAQIDPLALSLLALARGSLPGQISYSVRVKSLISVDAGGTSKLVQFGVANGPTVQIDADVTTATMKSNSLTLGGDGTLANTDDYELRVKTTGGGNKTRVHAVVALWRPGD